MRLRITLLGTFQVTRGDAVIPLPGVRIRGLVVRLALAAGRAVEPGVLVGAIWADDPPAEPGNALQALVSRLRRSLGSAAGVEQVPGGYRLDVAAADVDALRFEQLVEAGRERLRAGDPRTAAALLGEAVALWAPPTVVAAAAPAAATRLNAMAVEAVADLADAELSAGRAEEAAARLTALLAEQPVHERAAGLLMDAYAAQGRQADALALYEQVRAALAGSLGIDPGAALRERHVGMLRNDKPASPPTGNLPAPLSSFIGRDDDLARIGSLFTAGRLVTVVGPGGAGKTRLAVEAARRHRHEYRDGAWLIDLAAVTEPAKIGAVVLAGIGRRGGPGSELDRLTEELSGRETLLVVDNCEHLVDAVAHLLAALLARCAGLRVLATSREPLAIEGEALVPLGPLPLPEGDDLEPARRTASVRLFAERAAAVRPGLEVDPDMLRVVRGLDGLPLALELAAARLRTLSLPELAAGLSDRFRLLSTGRRDALPRHRTLRAVIAWSWELLADDERTVAERVAVLPGGVTPASAEAVCAGTAVPSVDVPDLLAGLVDRSLLQLGNEPGRYRMLETIREYGTERLAAAGDLGPARDLAATYFAGLIDRYDPLLRGPGQLTAMTVIGAEYDNTLAALRRRCDTGDAGGAVALALRLTWYWMMFGRQPDVAYWLGEALAVPGGEPSPDRDCAAALHLINRAGTRAEIAGAETRALADRLLAYPELPGPYGALAAFGLGLVLGEPALVTVLDRLATGDDVWLSGLGHLLRAEFAENAGRLDGVRPGIEAALNRFRQAGDRWGQASALPIRAQLRQYDGDLDGALADLREARALDGEFGSLTIGDQVYSDLRWFDLHLRRGDTALAIATIDAAREGALRANSPDLLALVDVREAEFRVRLGDLDRAGELLDDAERGLPAFLGDHLRTLIGAVRAALGLETGDRDGAERLVARAYAAALETGDRPILALVAVTSAALAGTYGRHPESAVLLGAAARLRGAHDRTDRQIGELTRRGEAALGRAGFAAAYEKGWKLETEAAVTEVGRLGPPRR